MPGSALSLRVAESIAEVPKDAWSAVLGPDPVPFLRWEWLNALESSGSASPEHGWEPHHLTLWRGGRLVGAAPAYRKHHSMGEYVYDFGWAHAAQQLGVRYYPKLLIGVPLSPITAPRLLVAPGEDVAATRRALVDAALELAGTKGCSSLHVLFPPEDELPALEAAGLFVRSTLQYHWRNVGYRTYDDYLSRFDSKRRNQLKRERNAAAGQGIALHTARGDELTPVHADLAYRLYEATSEKNGWGHLQLNREFFRRAFATLSSSFEMVEARRGGKVVAGAFNVAWRNRLFGRYWGCFEEHPFLHFHVCLYHSIDECIRLGRAAFEPGAGGEHKISRGFEPTAIHSAHRLFHPRLEQAVRRAVGFERAQVLEAAAQSEAISGLRPWRGRSPGTGG